MTEVTDEQIIAKIQSDPDTLDRLSESTLLDLWLLKCRRDPKYKPIKGMVRKALSGRIHGKGR